MRHDEDAACGRRGPVDRFFLPDGRHFVYGRTFDNANLEAMVDTLLAVGDGQ